MRPSVADLCNKALQYLPSHQIAYMAWVKDHKDIIAWSQGEFPIKCPYFVEKRLRCIYDVIDMLEECDVDIARWFLDEGSFGTTPTIFIRNDDLLEAMSMALQQYVNENLIE